MRGGMTRVRRRSLTSWRGPSQRAAPRSRTGRGNARRAGGACSPGTARGGPPPPPRPPHSPTKSPAHRSQPIIAKPPVHPAVPARLAQPLRDQRRAGPSSRRTAAAPAIRSENDGKGRCSRDAPVRQQPCTDSGRQANKYQPVSRRSEQRERGCHVAVVELAFEHVSCRHLQQPARPRPCSDGPGNRRRRAPGA